MEYLAFTEKNLEKQAESLCVAYTGSAWLWRASWKQTRAAASSDG